MACGTPSARDCAVPGASRAPACLPVRRIAHATAPASKLRAPGRGSWRKEPSQPTSSAPLSKARRGVTRIGRAARVDPVEERRAARGESVSRQAEPAREKLGAERTGPVGSLGRIARRHDGHERRRERVDQRASVSGREQQTLRGRSRRRDVDEPRPGVMGARASNRLGGGAGIQRRPRGEAQAGPERDAQARTLGHRIARGQGGRKRAALVGGVERVEEGVAEERGHRVVDAMRVERGRGPGHMEGEARAIGRACPSVRRARRDTCQRRGRSREKPPAADRHRMASAPPRRLHRTPRDASVAVGRGAPPRPARTIRISPPTTATSAGAP